MIRRYIVETVRSGQSQPYADHQYEYILTVDYTFQAGGEFKPGMFSSEKEMMRVAKCLLQFHEKDDPDTNWASKFLTKVEEIEKGKYRFLCIAAYTG